MPFEEKELLGCFLSHPTNPHPVPRQTLATPSSSPLHTPDPIAPLPERPFSAVVHERECFGHVFAKGRPVG